MRRSLPLSLLLSLLSACGGAEGGSAAPGVVDAAPEDAATGFNADAAPLEDGAASDAGSCASTISDGTRIPANVLFLFDTSKSMIEAAGRWDKARAAISQVLEASPDDLRVGIRFFPYPSNACTEEAYATPQVPVAPLATTRAAIQCWLGTRSDCGSIPKVSADGGTPMMRALSGAVTYMKGLSSEGARTIVLVTDGDPHACKDSDTIEGVLAAAKRAATGEGPKVTVWVVGAAGGTTSNLSRVAEAGEGRRTPTCVGATNDPAKACNFTAADATLAKDLLEALSAITGKVRSCTFALPEGASADPGKVNVEISGETVPRDASRKNGWDYDEGGKTITLHGPHCDRVREDEKARVRIVLGCKTKLL